MAVGLLSLMVATASVSAAIPSGPTARAEVRISSGAEWDTNSRRSVRNNGDGEKFVPDGLMRLVLAAGGELTLTRDHLVSFDYTLGAKRFFREGTEDLLVQDLGLLTRHRLGSLFFGSLDGRLRSSRTRSGSRDYSLGAAGASLGLQILDDLSIGANGGWLAFEYPTNHQFDYRGPRVGTVLTYRPIPPLSIVGRGDYVSRRYENDGEPIGTTATGVASMLEYCNQSTPLDPGQSCELRRDHELQLSIGATFRSRILVGAEYFVRLQRSTKELERVDRHRITAFATIGLPYALTLSAMGALQFNVGLSATDNANPAEDDENQNSVQVQLRRDLFDGLMIEARYALFANRFATSTAQFSRHTAYLGVAYRVGLLDGDLGPEIGYESRR